METEAFKINIPWKTKEDWDIKVLKETENKFSSKLVDQETRLSTISISFEERLDNISVDNTVGGKIVASTLKL